MDALSTSPSNQRVAAIKKFCMRPPARGMRLRLVPADESTAGQCLGEWTREVANDNAGVPHEVAEALAEHCQTLARPVEAILAWVCEQGEIVTTKRLKERPRAGHDEDPVAFAAMGITGEQSGQVVQMQRHLEAMTKSYLHAHQAQIATLTGLVQQLGGLLGDQHERYEQLRQQYERSEHDAAVASAEVNAESEAKAEMIRQVGEGLKVVVPMVTQHVLAKKVGA